MQVAALKQIRLGADSRDGRSQIADAIAVLRNEAGVGEYDEPRQTSIASPAPPARRAD